MAALGVTAAGSRESSMLLCVIALRGLIADGRVEAISPERRRPNHRVHKGQKVKEVVHPHYFIPTIL